MTTVKRDIFINAPVDAVEAISLDGRRLPEWFAGIERAEPDGVYPQAGGKVNLVYKTAGVTFNITMTSLELKRGQSVIYQMEGMIAGTSGWVTAPEGSGTRLTATFDYDMPGGGLGQVIDKLVVERMNVENLEKSLKSLKALVEG